MSDVPETNADSAGEILLPQKKRLTITWGKVITVLGIVVVVGTLFLPATRNVRGAARRLQCASNLKQIALALHGYHHAYKTFPPACTVDSHGRPLHSWRTLILPYLDELPRYEKIDLSKPWDDPANAEVYKAQTPLCFRCPARDLPANHTTYLTIVSPASCFRPGPPCSLSDITDAPDATLLVIETAPQNAVHWMAPMDTDENWLLSLGPKTKLAHPGGINVIYVDGHVEFLQVDTSAAERRARISIAGND
jgi:prepilin-type processing-associated H-X9-DG protein